MTTPAPGELRPSLISFPFRLGDDGTAVTVVQDSDIHVDELIAQAMLTGFGERQQVPTYGVADPAFEGFEAAALERHLTDFGPHVFVDTVSVKLTDGGEERVEIRWSHDKDYGGGYR